MLKCNNLSKSFSGNKVISNLSIEVQQNEKIIISGENGCGKSTFAKLILGVLSPDSGSILCQGDFGWMPAQSESFFPELTGQENLYAFGSFNLMSKADIDLCIEDFSELLSKEILEGRFKTFSSGMQQKLNLVRALLHKPRVLILDEPLAHMDQVSCQFVVDKLSSYDGVVIVMSHLKDLWDQNIFKHLKFESINAQ
tara:strand:- start:4408 stop:4998 length:591 start_codon:yes stop_codon:yes gene_type:complete